MAAWAARASGVHIRAAGTTEIPVRSEVSCDQAAQTWNESGTPPAGVHTLSNPSRAASMRGRSQLVERKAEPGVQPDANLHDR